MDHTVLMIDDNANVLHGLTRVLRNQPYQLCTAQSGSEAMVIFKARSVDVIVSDEQMPEISGCDLLAWVSKSYPDVYVSC
jgi:DNA-binding NtrC family response regulator